MSFQPLEERIALTAGITNLELASGFVFGTGRIGELDETQLAFTVAESSQNVDLNADGDLQDSVLHAYDALTGTTTNLGFATEDVGGQQLNQEMHNGLLVAGVYESFHGNTDLNGDGDTVDIVLHVFDLNLGTTTNLGVAFNGIDVDGGRAAFMVWESGQGNTDLNADGDAFDTIMHVFDYDTLTITNLGLAATGFQLDGDWLMFQVSEPNQGNMDLNGDGDASDFSVTHIYDTRTGITTNLGLQSGGQLKDGLIALRVPESGNGNTDLNGDGDVIDTVLHLFDLNAQTLTNLGLDGGFVDVQQNLVAFKVSEDAQGHTDLNGDGDNNDRVVHLYDVITSVTTNIGLAGDFDLNASRVAILVSEGEHGNTDLNADGDTSDSVMHLFDSNLGTHTNLGLATPFSFRPFKLDENLLAFAVSESAQGGSDLNGDADTQDSVLHVFDASSGATTNVGLDSRRFGNAFQVDSGTVTFTVAEFAQASTDLNGDGDTSDRVLHVFDANTGQSANIGLVPADGGVQLNGNLLAVAVSEEASDLNGDTDTFDAVVHVVDLAIALPSTFVEDLVADVENLNLQRGIENSLDAKLDAAITVLGNLNDSNVAAAINSLEAFINFVEAQRDKKISDTQADDLIANARLVIELLDI